MIFGNFPLSVTVTDVKFGVQHNDPDSMLVISLNVKVISVTWVKLEKFSWIMGPLAFLIVSLLVALARMSAGEKAKFSQMVSSNSSRQGGEAANTQENRTKKRNGGMVVGLRLRGHRILAFKVGGNVFC